MTNNDDLALKPVGKFMFVMNRWHQTGSGGIGMWRVTERGRSQVILTEYKYDRDAGKTHSVFLVRHSSSVAKTTLEQKITIERDRYGRFTPTLELDDFPQDLSDRESMLKLADWLHRLGVAIEDNWGQP